MNSQGIRHVSDSIWHVHDVQTLLVGIPATVSGCNRWSWTCAWNGACTYFHALGHSGVCCNILVLSKHCAD